MSETRSYPRHAKTDAGDIEFRLMSRADEQAVLAFLDAVRAGKTLSARDALATHELCERVVRAVRERSDAA